MSHVSFRVPKNQHTFNSNDANEFEQQQQRLKNKQQGKQGDTAAVVDNIDRCALVKMGT